VPQTAEHGPGHCSDQNPGEAGHSWAVALYLPTATASADQSHLQRPHGMQMADIHATARLRTTRPTRSQKAGTSQCVPIDMQTKEENSHRRSTSPRLLPAPISTTSAPAKQQAAQMTRAFAHPTLLALKPAHKTVSLTLQAWLSVFCRAGKPQGLQHAFPRFVLVFHSKRCQTSQKDSCTHSTILPGSG
jgi:hypothetical protein